MAVFPDRIILKNSDDDQATIEAAIGSGGQDEIVYGELVIGRENGSAQLYTVDAAGNIVTISGGGVTRIIAGTNVTISPTGGTGDVTINATGSGGGSATLGRGDGGDIDDTAVDSAFVFGIWGGGDLDTTTEDKPVELVVIGIVDGGDIT